MLTILHSTALLALSGLLVPVAIHLWNRRPAREIAVGSLRWLAAGANRRLRNLNLEQVWLLLLRAALLAVLAVAGAGPVWRTARPTSRGVVLLSADAARLPTLAGIRPTIDSLRRKGYVLRWLSAGFPRVSGAAWQRITAGLAVATADSLATAAATDQSQEFAWARVSQATDTFSSQPVFVVTSTALRHLQGSHLPVPAAVTWQLLPDTTSASWLQAATMWGKRGDSLRLLVGHSQATQTTFRTETLPDHNEIHEEFRVSGLPPLRLDTLADGGRTFDLIPTRPGSGLEIPINCGTPPQVIEIYASPEYASDVRYLEAALRAAATGLLNPPLLRRVQTRPEHLVGHWTFWLSNEALPQNWQRAVRQGATVWQEAAGPGLPDTARFATADASAATGMVFRRGARPPGPRSATVWPDSRGRAVLSRRVLGRGAAYQLHTRLAPPWSELADDPQLPARLLQLLQPEPTDAAAAVLYHPQNPGLEQELSRFDHRALDQAQLTTAPRMQPRATPVRAAGERTTDLRPWLVLVAGLLFLVERWLAGRQDSVVLPISI